MPAGDIYGLKWANAKEVTIIEDFGTWTNATTQTGFTGFTVRATFTVELKYHRFPFDQQELEMTVQAPTSLPRSMMFFTSKATLSPNLRQHNLWSVTNVTTASGVKPFIDAYANGNPRYEIPKSVFTIHLSRKINYYLFNYIILEIVLCILGLTSLFIPAESIDGRLGIGLTLVLAINVFQVVLVENMPTTGYLTDMHLFTFLNTVLLGAVCAESIIVYAAVKYVEIKGQLLTSLKLLIARSSSDKLALTATHIAAVTRGMLVRHRLRKWRALQAAKRSKSLSKVVRVGSRCSHKSASAPADAPAVAIAVDKKSATSVNAVSVQVEGSAGQSTMEAYGLKDMSTIGRNAQQKLARGLRKAKGQKTRVEKMRGHFRRYQRRCGDATAVWIAGNLDNWCVVIFPCILALILGCSFDWTAGVSAARL